MTDVLCQNTAGLSVWIGTLGHTPIVEGECTKLVSRRGHTAGLSRLSLALSRVEQLGRQV